MTEEKKPPTQHLRPAIYRFGKKTPPAKPEDKDKGAE